MNKVYVRCEMSKNIPLPFLNVEINSLTLTVTCLTKKSGHRLTAKGNSSDLYALCHHSKMREGIFFFKLVVPCIVIQCK